MLQFATVMCEVKLPCREDEGHPAAQTIKCLFFSPGESDCAFSNTWSVLEKIQPHKSVVNMSNYIFHDQSCREKQNYKQNVHISLIKKKSIKCQIIKDLRVQIKMLGPSVAKQLGPGGQGHHLRVWCRPAQGQPCTVGGRLDSLLVGAGGGGAPPSLYEEAVGRSCPPAAAQLGPPAKCWSLSNQID